MLGEVDRYDDIDRYVTDKMTPNERESFIKELESDTALRAQVHLVEDIKGSLVRREAKVKQIKKWHQDRIRKKRIQTNVIRISTISVAAALIIGAFISYPTSYYGLQERGFEMIIRSDSSFNLLSYWDCEKYDDCLVAIKNEIASYREAIAHLDSENMPIEEYEWKIEEYSMQIDNLKWANIQTLLKMRRYNEALLSTEEYISSNGIRMESATKLKKKLSRKLH